MYLIVELFFLIAKFLKDSQFKNAFEVRYLFMYFKIFNVKILIAMDIKHIIQLKYQQILNTNYYLFLLILFLCLIFYSQALKLDLNESNVRYNFEQL